MLCNLCTRLFRDRSQAGCHHQDGNEIVKASRGGCYICRMVVGRLEGKRADVARMENFQYTFEGYTLRIFSHTYQIPPIWWTKNCAFKLICVEDEAHLRRLSTNSPKPTLQGEAWKIVQDEIYLNLRDSTAHPDVLDLARDWLHECVEGHVGCHVEDNEEDWYPPRLIDVTLRPPRLIDCDFEPPKGPYATLSYCWGKENFVMLTAESMKDFAKGIPFELLPQNFREAIQVTETLGIKYLWIDAICILQDGEGSVQDWRDNAALAGKIYQNCALNISAACSPHADSGFFIRRGSTLVPQQYVYWHENKGSSLKFLSSKKVFMVTQEPFSEIALSPLAKRGWALQERLYSPRILHFGARQILWECRRNHNEGGRRSETFPTGLPHWMSNATNVHALRQYDPSIIGNSRIPTSWNEIVSEYSTKRLTKPTEDKLVALQSLVLEYQSRNPRDEYIAGIWKSKAVEQLMWFLPSEWLKEGRAVRARKGSTFRAPSWSWASIDGPVTLRKPYDSSFTTPISYLSHKIKPIDSRHIAGQLAHAEINLKAHIVIATIEKMVDDDKRKRYTVCAENGSDLDKLYWDDIDIGEVDRAEDLFGLLLFEYSRSKDKGFSMAGLLLRKRSKSHPVFSRLGKWACDGTCRPLLDYFLAQSQTEVVLV